MDAIKRRRSIRRFKSTPLTETQLETLMEAARLAPSGSNVQPWRFILVADENLRKGLLDASFGQRCIEEAPVIIVCCGDLLSWKTTRERTQEILNLLDLPIGEPYRKALMQRVDKALKEEFNKRIPTTMMNVAIAVEHVVLEAVELGLGSCWVRIFDEKKVRRLFDLPEHICIVALLPIGIPNEEPEPRPRLPLSALILPIHSATSIREG
jgi:nitroreductase